MIAAIGQQVEDGALIEGNGIKFNRWSCVATDRVLATSRPGVFAGGDCVTGPSTLVYAMAAGLKAARNINDWIQHGSVRFFRRSRMRKLLADNRMLANELVEAPVRHAYRVHNPELDPDLRKQMFEEVERTINASRGLCRGAALHALLSRLFRRHQTSDPGRGDLSHVHTRPHRTSRARPRRRDHFADHQRPGLHRISRRDDPRLRASPRHLRADPVRA